MSSKTILIIDDVQFDRELLSRAILKKLNSEVIGVESGQEAFEVLDSRHIDLILLDIKMPKMPGDEVLDRIRKSHGPEVLPIVMISGQTEEAMIIKCLKSGANDYISKPINLAVAISRISAQLDLSAAIKDRVKLKEMDAIKAMVITYNHEINNALAIAMGNLQRLENENQGNVAFQKTVSAMDRIAEIVKKIREVTILKELPTESYSESAKMVKIK